ncbi:MAG: 30S ribosomal protein S16 [Chloroflexi bacterium]|nr:MAG: 30S ribosomal protein S16 [Chloroflexota bacterium]
MVKIRLRRVGTKNKPSYQVVAVDARAPRDGAYIEKIGYYNPLTDPETVSIDQEKALKWLRHGAQPTESVARLLSKLGIAARSSSEQR